MNCPEKECLCAKACEILGECVLHQPVIVDYQESFKSMIVPFQGKKRLKKIVRILEAIRPHKVHIHQLNRYWGLKTYEGLDLDNDGVPKRMIRRQMGFKNAAARLLRNEILMVLMDLKKPLKRKQLIKLNSDGTDK